MAALVGMAGGVGWVAVGSGHPTPSPSGGSALASPLGTAAAPRTPSERGVWESTRASLPDPELQSRAVSLVRRTGGRATWGLLAVSLDTGDTLLSLNPELPLIPASNVKVLTTAAALHHLGPDFRYRTFVLATGPVVDGRVDGDLVLYGTGDPAFSGRFASAPDEVLMSLAGQLYARGIREVAGSVLGDGTYFAGDDRHPTWDWRDLDDWFAAPASALSFGENVVTLKIDPATVLGFPPRIAQEPVGSAIPIWNQAVTVPGSRALRFMAGRDTAGGPVILRGALGLSARTHWRVITVDDGPLHAARAFRHVLDGVGIRVDGGADRVSAPTESPISGRGFWRAGSDDAGRARILAVHRSPPLSELVAVTNRRSHNLYAEMLLRTLGRVVGGEGSMEAGATVVLGFLREVAGIDTERVSVVDGSGLSPLNRLTAADFVQVLEVVHRSEWGPVFEASLPVAGGRDLRRMRSTAARDNLRAKTGTLRRVSALTGFVRTANGQRVAFSFLGNNVSSGAAKRIEDDLGARLAALNR